jgi:hypothetical protein
MTKDIKIYNVGTLTVTGPLFAAEGSGPNDGVLIENTLPGEWSVESHMFGFRPTDIVATHPSAKDQDLDFVMAFEPNGRPSEIGVDCGHAGFFDAKSLPAKPKTWSDKDHDEYREAFEKVGLKVMSGYGDGGYPLYVARNAEGQVVAAKLVFIAKPGGCETPGCENTTTDDQMGTCSVCEEEVAEQWRKCLWVVRNDEGKVVSSGHVFGGGTVEQGGVVCEILRTLAPKDAWHAAHGYPLAVKPSSGSPFDPPAVGDLSPSIHYFEFGDTFISVAHGDTAKAR